MLGGAQFDEQVAAATAESLDRLLIALELEQVGDDRFRMAPGLNQFDRVFGGQLLAQAIVAAGATVHDQPPQSLHAYFVSAGDTSAPLDLAVERVRDGRSMSTRRVTVTQDDRTLLVALTSFHSNPTTPTLATPPTAAVALPEHLALLQDFARDLPRGIRAPGRRWINRPPPVEIRIGEAPSFLGGPHGTGSRTHWMRLPRLVGDDPLLQSALLAHASDYLLLDMLMRAPVEGAEGGPAHAFSLDHALWFHRPIRFDQWHRYTQDIVALSGHRGLVRGTIHDADGQLVASVVQEGLIRPTRKEQP